jgi:hypothetical protein
VLGRLRNTTPTDAVLIASAEKLPQAAMGTAMLAKGAWFVATTAACSPTQADPVTILPQAGMMQMGQIMIAFGTDRVPIATSMAC